MSASVVQARAAIAGNPSDGYGGAVFSTMVPLFEARATVESQPVDEVSLVRAAKARFARDVSADVVDLPIDVSTTIPRSVGLAGSSAIVLASLSLCAQHVGVDLEPMVLARMAHAVERTDLGIAGGWQDQVVQSHGVTALMEFAEPITHHPVDVTATRAIPLFLALDETSSEASGVSHAELQARRDTPEVRAIMGSLAKLARQAAEAARIGDVHRLKEAIDETFDLRRQVMHIDPRHLAMVETARSHGAVANFAGSGGAIIGVVPKEAERFLAAMRHAGYQLHTWDLQ